MTDSKVWSSTLSKKAQKQAKGNFYTSEFEVIEQTAEKVFFFRRADEVLHDEM